MDDTEGLWNIASLHLRSQVADGTWQPWFAEIEPDEVDGDAMTLTVPSSVVRDRLEERFRPLLRQAVSEAAGRSLDVHIVVRTSPGGTARRAFEPGPARDIGNRGGTDPSEGRSPTRSARPSTEHGSSGAGRMATTPRPPPAQANGARELPSLNPRYVFEAFVIGASNRFAHAAAQRVAETPAASYNPLFIHGDSGLGKTHLLHAIGHYVIENFPARRVRYVSCETFMNDFVEAIRNNGQASFKRRYRDCDVLLVDDIQFLENKESFQEEFFHTFNSLYEGSKQIVLSSDRHPRSIATLEDRLRSRFEWGLTTDVQPPELETRLAILRKKAEGEPTPVPDEVLELIATSVRDNIRELEGALTRVSAYASLNHQTITRQKAEEVLADILDGGRPRQITPAGILDATAVAFGFEPTELTGPKRQRPLVRARQVGMYLCRELTDYSYPAIGREFGGRDHTTVIHAVERVSTLMKEDRRMYQQVTDLIYSLKGGR